MLGFRRDRAILKGLDQFAADMPLPAPDCSRTPLHNRKIRAHSFQREDGLWDIDAELIDTKAYDYPKRNGTMQLAGQPFHHMHLRITFDSSFVIRAAIAIYDAAPYAGECMSIEPAYGDLVGMNLLKGFRLRVKERFGRVAGCSHITELATILPTVALQTMANQRRLPEQDHSASRPFQLEGCHALRLDGAVVKEFYPQWYVQPRTS